MCLKTASNFAKKWQKKAKTIKSCKKCNNFILKFYFSIFSFHFKEFDNIQSASGTFGVFFEPRFQTRIVKIVFARQHFYQIHHFKILHAKNTAFWRISNLFFWQVFENSHWKLFICHFTFFQLFITRFHVPTDFQYPRNSN